VEVLHRRGHSGDAASQTFPRILAQTVVKVGGSSAPCSDYGPTCWKLSLACFSLLSQCCSKLH